MEHRYEVDEIRAEFERRKGRNEFYSMRAFARDLGVDHSLLVRVFKGERKVPPQLQKAFHQLMNT